MAPRSSSGSGSAASLEHEAAAGFAPSFAPAFAHTHGRPAEAERYVPTDVPLCDTPQPGEQYEGLLGDAFKNKPLLQRLDWKHVILLSATPLIALFGLCTWTFDSRTLAFAVFYYFFTGLGITAGYHRHFAHRAYDATAACRLMLLLMAAGAVEGSCRWWSRGHRAHHRYVDTDRDPYAVIKGFWHAHVGWMLVRQDPAKIGEVDIDDLDADELVAKKGLFNRFYLPIALFMGFILPTLACGLGWGDFYGGYFIAGVARLVFVHHSTFCVNSLAHWVGDATYTDGHTARNSIITALVTLGEGYHNFHHEFPNDYRNGVEWWQYDPTKHFIYALSLLGMATNLKHFPQNEIDKGMLQMRQKALTALKRRADWGPDPRTMPRISRADFDVMVKAGRRLVVLDGYVCDVEDFIADHPGGERLLRSKLGKDVTLDFGLHERPLGPGDAFELARPKAFFGPNAKAAAGAAPQLVVGTYKHSNAARSLAETLRVARIEGYVLPKGASPASAAAAALGLGGFRKHE